MTSNTSSDDVFEYMGRGQFVPNRVVSVQFHPNVTEVDAYAFSECRNLREVVLNEGLKKIEDRAFMRCTSLETITLPSTLTEIGIYVFYNCSGLREIVFHEGLHRIGDGSFHSCSLIQSITLPSTLTNIGDRAFCGCDLQEVVIMNEKTEICSNTFTSCSSLESFKFPILSSRFGALVRVGYSDIVNKTNNLPGVHYQITIQTPRRRKQQHNRRIGEIVIPAYRMVTILRRGYDPREHQKMRHNWVAIKSKLDMVVDLIACYEKKEATTLLELAFWKANMNQADDHPINGEADRIEVPGPAKDTIMQFL